MTRDEINAAMPYAGTCWLCGHHDKRHRMWDMWRGCTSAIAATPRPAFALITCFSVGGLDAIIARIEKQHPELLR